MTTEQAAEMLVMISEIRFYSQVIAGAVGIGLGSFCWYLTVVARNQREFL